LEFLDFPANIKRIPDVATTDKLVLVGPHAKESTGGTNNLQNSGFSFAKEFFDAVAWKWACESFN
jgi:hypothetical protein